MTTPESAPYSEPTQTSDQQHLAVPVLQVRQSNGKDASRLPVLLAAILSSITALVAMTALILTLWVNYQDELDDDRQLTEVQDDLEAERAQDESERQQEDCENAYIRALGRATDAVNVARAAVDAAEADAFDTLSLGTASPEYQAARVKYRTASDSHEQAAQTFSAAVVQRDVYVDAGRPLPCPID